MARYDRIAPLAAPSRSRVFSGWTALRDLEIGERNPDLGQRARVRFLALRPVHRLLARGIDSIPTESYHRQIEGVREELGHLSARDPERAQLAYFLHAISERTPRVLVGATLEMGERIEAAGHYFGAEEYYLTALEVAETYRLASQQVTALRLLGRVCRKAARWEPAESYYHRAIELAEHTADRRQWARAMDGLGVAFRYQGNYPKAGKIFEQVLEHGQSWQDDYIVATAYSSLCVNALTAEDLEHTLQYGWTAIRLFTDEEDRDPVLGNLGIAFTRLGMYPAAERCYEIIMSRSKKLVTYGHAHVEYAVVAAEAGDVATFHSRRQDVLRSGAEWSHEPWLGATSHLHLGRGCFLVGDTEFAREHLREAVAAGEAHGFHEVLIRAEELLTALETAALEGPIASRPVEFQAAGLAERIAGEVKSYGEELVTATT